MTKQFSKNLDTLFRDYMEKQNQPNGKFFTLECLAMFLDLLKSQNTVKRQAPGYLINRGRPNLILCDSQRDQIQIVLSIYAYSHQSPLPTNDEILFCNSQTNSEKVENFIRIALKSKGEKIYTLVNIQELSYETSIHVEKFLSSNTNLKPSDNYLLVFLGSTDRPEQSILASSLIKNRVTPILLQNKIIEEYLTQKLTTNQTNSLGFNDSSKSSIRALLSRRAGNGKSTYIEQFRKSIANFDAKFDYKIVRIKTTNLNIDNELEKLFEHKKIKQKPTLYHVDIATEVFKNVDLFVFNLAILSYLEHSNGQVWRRSSKDLYFIEMTPPYIKTIPPQSYHASLNYLPKIEFLTPNLYLYELVNTDNNFLLKDNLFSVFYQQKKFQRTALYLRIVNERANELESFRYRENVDRLNEADCLNLILQYSGLRNPNWADVYNFVNFLDNQLEVLENARLINEVTNLRGICARFIIMMAQDFGIPSLNLGDGSDVVNVRSDNRVEIQLDKLEIARHWENMQHPYIIFNADRQTFTFMGIYLDRRDYKFLNPNTKKPIGDTGIVITPQMRIDLLRQKVPIYDNFNDFPRTKKINSLRYVMGLDTRELLNYDPDPTYELTLDNCLKLMAIFMRLRCNNPVIVMGETG